MKINDNGIIREMTQNEVAEMENMQAAAEREYWTKTPYDELVNAEIRNRYTVSQELAILRQQAEKPAEYRQYFDYCEQCKAFVRVKRAEYGKEK